MQKQRWLYNMRPADQPGQLRQAAQINVEEKHMELKDTIQMMNSTDYKERFKAKYEQLRIRFAKLNAMLDKWDVGTLDFAPTCPRSTYNIQVRAMADYLAALEARAVMEGVSL